MTIHLPQELETPVRAAVLSGQFASEDDLVAEAVRAFLRQHPQASPPTNGLAASEREPAATHKPIWERILERTAKIPDEEWDKLPTDLAERHDHYLYGSPRRPTT